MRGYSFILLKSSGTNLNAYDVVLISRCFTLLGQLVSSVAMPYIGRKLVYCVSCALTGVSLIGFGWAHWLHPLNSQPFAVAIRNETMDNCKNIFSLNLCILFFEFFQTTSERNFKTTVFLCLAAFGFCFGLSGIPYLAYFISF